MANNAGVVTLSKYAMGANGPTFQGEQIVYDWNGGTGGSNAQSQAQNVTLAVDSSVQNFVDPDTGQRQYNPYSGNVYVAWNTIDQDGANGGDWLSPQAIYVIGSSDGGTTFTSPQRISTSGFTRDSGGAVNGLVGHRMPRMVVSQGAPFDPVANPAGARGGQVSFVWDDYASGTGSTVNPFDVVRYDQTQGVLAEQFVGPAGPINDAVDPGNGAAHIPGVSTYTVNVNFTENRFVTINDLDVNLRVNHSAVNELRIRLIPPASSGLASIVLLDNGVDAANVAVPNAVSATGAGLGLGRKGWAGVRLAGSDVDRRSAGAFGLLPAREYPQQRGGQDAGSAQR